jgi:tRNA (mo5U34)-methyltransferase
MSQPPPPSPSFQDEIAQIRWFHSIPLGNGIYTPGLDNTAEKLDRIRFPEDLSGRSVLDIGAWDGFFSFEAERRGAPRVVAVDSYCWDGDGWANKSGFDLVHRHLNSRVEARRMEVLEVSPAELGTFDVVLFLGVLYHLKHPLLALEKVAAVTQDLLILETKVDLLSTSAPAMAFYQNAELNRDPTNWWAPNLSGLEQMLRDVGFKRIEIVSPPKSIWSRIFRRPSQPGQWWREIQQGRVTVHAWK